MKNKKTFDPKKIEMKLKLASDLFEMAFKMKRFQLKNKFPHLSEKVLTQKAYALIERGCS